MNSKLIKGMFLALAGALAPLLTTNPIIWSIVLITLIGTALMYLGKNAIPGLKSASLQGEFSLANMISTVLVLVGTAIVSGAASFIVDGAINWMLLFKTSGGVAGSYVMSTLFEGSKPSAPLANPA